MAANFFESPEIKLECSEGSRSDYSWRFGSLPLFLSPVDELRVMMRLMGSVPDLICDSRVNCLPKGIYFMTGTPFGELLGELLLPLERS